MTDAPLSPAATPSPPPVAGPVEGSTSPVQRRPRPEGMVSALVLLGLLVAMELLGWTVPSLPDLGLSRCATPAAADAVLPRR